MRTIDDVYDWDQVASQGLKVEVEHGTLGRLTLPGPPLRFFDRSGDEVTRTRARRASRRSTSTGAPYASWLSGERGAGR